MKLVFSDTEQQAVKDYVPWVEVKKMSLMTHLAFGLEAVFMPHAQGGETQI